MDDLVMFRDLELGDIMENEDRLWIKTSVYLDYKSLPFYVANCMCLSLVLVGSIKGTNMVKKIASRRDFNNLLDSPLRGSACITVKSKDLGPGNFIIYNGNVGNGAIGLVITNYSDGESSVLSLSEGKIFSLSVCDSVIKVNVLESIEVVADLAFNKEN